MNIRKGRVRSLKRRYKYPEDHKYFRSEKDIVSDLMVVRRARLTHKSKVSFVNSLLWGWSERHGKYVGCVCSAMAYSYYQRRRDFRGLRHDHSVPRNVVVKYLLNKKTRLSKKKLHKFLKNNCGAVVLTKREDGRLSRKGLRQKMPSTWKWNDPFARYKMAGIKILKNKRLGD